MARLYPDVFGRLADFCARYRDYLDPVIGRFDREIQFYLGYLELIERLRAAGLQFCYPRVSAKSKQVFAEDSFDIALASKLREPEHGGLQQLRLTRSGSSWSAARTRAARQPSRVFGQLHHLSGLGLPVPGAAHSVPARPLFTHFERRRTWRRSAASSRTNCPDPPDTRAGDGRQPDHERELHIDLDDAVVVGGMVLREIERGLLCVCVTFVDELASLGAASSA